jgi:hypothetical protein
VQAGEHSIKQVCEFVHASPVRGGAAGEYMRTKEWGFFCTYYTYITVLIRNATNLTLLLLKGSKYK